MSHRSPVGVSERHAFDAVIDARSPAEFAIDHIPGAVNYPVLDDEERRIVGTLYKQQGAFEARRARAEQGYLATLNECADAGAREYVIELAGKFHCLISTSS